MRYFTISFIHYKNYDKILPHTLYAPKTNHTSMYLKQANSINTALSFLMFQSEMSLYYYHTQHFNSGSVSLVLCELEEDLGSSLIKTFSKAYFRVQKHI